MLVIDLRVLALRLATIGLTCLSLATTGAAFFGVHASGLDPAYALIGLAAAFGLIVAACVCDERAAVLRRRT